jgi:hypothetical protein
MLTDKELPGVGAVTRWLRGQPDRRGDTPSSSAPVEPPTRIDIPVLTPWRRARLLLGDACRGASVSFLLLLLCLPVALWGIALAYTLRPDWVLSLVPAFHLFAPVYLTAASALVAVGKWRAARELFLAVLLLIAASHVVVAGVV